MTWPPWKRPRQSSPSAFVKRFFTARTIEWVSAYPSVWVILKGQGVAHPGGYGAIPRLLGHYSRDRGWLGLADAIRKVTSLPADRLGIADRGRVVPGAAADLVLFDPLRIGEAGSYARPDRLPHGIEQVLINGRTVVRRGELVDGRAGAVLRFGT